MNPAPAPFDRFRRRLGGMVQRYRYGVSALDQIALSVFGFALNLCLVRALSATDYGIVTLWMAIGLLAIGIQDALVNTPLSTHVPAALDAESASRLGEAIAIVNLLLIGATAATVVLVNFCVDAEWSPHDILAVVAIPLFVTAGMYREFYRSLAFSRNDMAMLLRTDIPYLAVTMLCVAGMLAWPERFANLAAAFFAMTAGCIAARLCTRSPFTHLGRRLLQPGWMREYRQVVRDAAWAVVGVLTTHLHQRSYIYVTVNLVGLAGLAAINVVGLLFRPVRMMVTAWGRTALPNMAADLAAGRVAAVDRSMARAFAAAAAGSIVWLGALWLGWGLIDRHFFVGQYPDAWSLAWPWAIAAALDAMSYIVSIALRAAREFKFLAFGTMLSAPVTVAATVGAVLWQGYTWTMYGVAVGYLVAFAVEGARLYVVRRRVLRRFGLPEKDRG